MVSENVRDRLEGAAFFTGAVLRGGTHSPLVSRQSSFMSRNSFGKSQRVLSRTEYKKILGQGLKLRSKSFVLFVLENGKRCNRLGLIVTKKTGKAVTRNQIKRRIREYFRTDYDRLIQRLVFHDVVFLAQQGSEALTPADVGREMEQLYERYMHRFNQRVPKDPIPSVA